MSTTAQRRRMFLQNAKRNLRIFLKSKLGVAGAAIIIFFFLIAILAPYLTSNDPIFGTGVSSAYSVPAWATFLPQYQNFPPSLSFLAGGALASDSDVGHWTIHDGNGTSGIGAVPIAKGALVTENALMINRTFITNGSQTGGLLPGLRIFNMSQSFQYSSSNAPSEFVLQVNLKPVSLVNVSTLYVNFVVASPTQNYSIGNAGYFPIRTQIAFTKTNIGNFRNVSIDSSLLPASGNPLFPLSKSPTQIIFSTTGTYTLSVQLVVTTTGDAASVAVDMNQVSFHTIGSSYGLLGTDDEGRDLWSQFVWGAQISFIVGVLSALGSVVIGTVTGLASGLAGGWVDETISRFTDFFLVIPFLPVAVVVIFILGQNPIIYRQIYYWIVILFVALSWPTITRIVRSQVLTVKERQFVEASRALGGGSGHIMRKHILPNVLGLVYAQIALLVPGFILLEAALDFLAVGTHPIGTITWGIMLTEALPHALTDSIHGYVWWWFLPPGIAIAVLSLAWVMLSYGLDSVFNPKLRER